MEKPKFRFYKLVSLAIAAIVMGGLGGMVIGGLTGNASAGWSFFALSVSHVVAGGIGIILTHEIE